MTIVVAVVLMVAGFSFLLGWYLGRIHLMADEMDEMLKQHDHTDRRRSDE
jgi:hypothetical protein